MPDDRWRWCFFLNLPVGGLTIVIVLFTLKIPTPPSKKKPSIPQQFRQLDPIGTACFLPSIICLLLALQWGGGTYAWKDGRIIALFVLFGVLLLAFIGIQWWKNDTATLPPRILKRRSILAGVIFAFCSGSIVVVMSYYLPIWFQAIKGVTAVDSGIMLLPLMLGLVASSILAGIIITRVGYYTPALIFSTIATSVGTGLLTTFKPTTAHPEWIGYQILIGIGLGTGLQQTNLAAQTTLERKDVATGVALMMFAQSIGGAVFLSVGQSALNNTLAASLSDLPGFNAKALASQGATEVRRLVQPEYLRQVLQAYNDSVVKVFYIAVAAACFSVFGSAAMEWRSVKKGKPSGGPASGAQPAGQTKPAARQEAEKQENV